MVGGRLKHIYLIRHCQASGQDPAARLTPEGHMQAKRLADFFAGIEVRKCVSSPFVRAVDTIRPLCEAKGLELALEERLRERVLSTLDLGDWLDKLQATYEDHDLKFTGGETTREAMARGTAVVAELLTQEEAEVIVVTHGALMSLILGHFEPEFGFEQWKQLSNPDVFRLDFLNQSFRGATRLWGGGT